MAKECHGCGKEYKKLGAHLSRSSCDYADFTDEQKQIIEGMMLGDGWINHQSKVENAKPFFAVGMTNYTFLEWLDEKLSPHTTGVKNASGSRNSNKPYYKIRSMRTPKLAKFAEWYSTGKLELQHVDLTPLSLKMWFVSDGSYLPDKQIISIGNKIATNREEFFDNLFEELDVNPRVYETQLTFNQADTQTLFEFMGSPPPGFENKWPRDRLDELKAEKAKADKTQATL